MNSSAVALSATVMLLYSVLPLCTDAIRQDQTSHHISQDVQMRNSLRRQLVITQAWLFETTPHATQQGKLQKLARSKLHQWPARTGSRRLHAVYVSESKRTSVTCSHLPAPGITASCSMRSWKKCRSASVMCLHTKPGSRFERLKYSDAVYQNCICPSARLSPLSSRDVAACISCKDIA